MPNFYKTQNIFVMRKIIFTTLCFFFFAGISYAGGIVHNTNQSAAFIRTMDRAASVDVDAVFYNPAGLTRLEDGFYIQVNNQFIKQTRTIVSGYPTLNNGKYEGVTNVPLFPSVYLAYKKGKFAASAGLTVVGGGGSAEFARGLPSFEQDISTLPTALAGLEPIGQSAGVDLSVSGYDVDMYFKGSSAYFGFQGAVSYAVSDNISLAVGGRYVKAQNSYEGYIRDISLNTGAAGMMRADAFLNNMAVPTLNGLANNLTGITTIPAQLDPAIQSGYGDATLADLQSAEVLSAEDVEVISAGVIAVGGDPSVMTLNQIHGAITLATPTLQANAAELQANAQIMSATAATLGDVDVDVEQTGSTFVPFFSVDVSLLEGDLGIAIKYEMPGKMTITNQTTVDGSGLFPDKKESPAEIPGWLSVGVRYQSGPWDFHAGLHYYGDQGVKYGKTDAAGEYVTNGADVTLGGQKSQYILSNMIEVGFGAGYDLNDNLGVSAGFLYGNSDPSDYYQSDLSYTNDTQTVGLGAWYKVSDKFQIDLGFSNTWYTDYERNIYDYNESFDKTTITAAIGLSYVFGDE